MEQVTLLEVLLGMCVGVSLSAACGFRVFTPLLVVSVAVHFFGFHVNESFQWLGSWLSLIILATATLVEILAYYIPWADNVLGIINTPLALVAGAMVMCGVLPDVHPCLKWSIAGILGGGVAGVSHIATGVVRGASSLATGGAANNIVASSENACSVIFSVLAIVIPVIAFTVIALIMAALLFSTWKILQWRHEG